MTIPDTFHHATGVLDRVREQSMQHVTWVVSIVAFAAGVAMALLPPAVAGAVTFERAFEAAHPVTWALALGIAGIGFALTARWKPEWAFVPGFALCLIETALSILILLSIPQSHLPLTGVLLVGYGLISGLCALYYTHRR